jgi:hypothetical protein
MNSDGFEVLIWANKNRLPTVPTCGSDLAQASCGCDKAHLPHLIRAILRLLQGASISFVERTNTTTVSDHNDHKLCRLPAPKNKPLTRSFFYKEVQDVELKIVKTCSGRRPLQTKIVSVLPMTLTPHWACGESA